MKGRDGDYPVDTGVHVTRVFSHDEFSSAFDWADFAKSHGIEPTLVETGLRGESERWPLALAVCTCRWSRPAPSRVMARSSAFVHKQLAHMAGCETG